MSLKIIYDVFETDHIYLIDDQPVNGSRLSNSLDKHKLYRDIQFFQRCDFSKNRKIVSVMSVTHIIDDRIWIISKIKW